MNVNLDRNQLGFLVFALDRNGMGYYTAAKGRWVPLDPSLTEPPPVEVERVGRQIAQEIKAKGYRPFTVSYVPGNYTTAQLKRIISGRVLPVPEHYCVWEDRALRETVMQSLDAGDLSMFFD